MVLAGDVGMYGVDVWNTMIVTTRRKKVSIHALHIIGLMRFHFLLILASSQACVSPRFLSTSQYIGVYARSANHSIRIAPIIMSHSVPKTIQSNMSKRKLGLSSQTQAE